MSCVNNWRNPPLSAQGLTIPLQWAGNQQDRPTSAQIQILETTLGLLPFEHLQRFVQSNGYIRASGPSCTPASGGGYGTSPSYIRLSYECWRDSFNFTYQYTFLHEFGHWVDETYQALNGLRQSARAEYDFLVAASHHGRTNGSNERFADCYAIFVFRYIGGAPYNHRPRAADYRGAEGRRRFLALFLTPAFANLQPLQTRVPAVP